MDFYVLKIKEIEKSTENAVIVSFEIPTKLEGKFTFEAGQYVTLETEIEGELIRRAYSICSSPKEKNIAVGIKKVSGGVFSTFANESLKKGMSIQVSEPQGRFIFKTKDTPQIITAVAAGSGITPILSILKMALSSHSETQMKLIYGNKSPEETMFYSELKELKNSYSNRLSIEWVFSRSNEENALFGRIDLSVIKRNIKKETEVSNAYFLCGPEKMVEEVKEVLSDEKIGKEKIHYELFTSSKQNETTIPVNRENSNVEIEVIYDEVSSVVKTASNSKTVLDSVLGKKLDVPHSCQGGVCCSCIARLKEGEVSFVENDILTDEEIEEGLILTCKSTPISSRIVVDYDDI